MPTTDALSLFPGGRARMRDLPGAPSRAAMKLEEALAWFGYGPEPGDLCVDLGAAPGGWTFVLLQRRARVIAVDPGRLAPSLAGRRGLTQVVGSAFDFEPREPVDWLFCDMAWRPLEVAALLARWARRRSARTLIANLKLPMKKKAEFAARLRGVVGSGGWRDVRTRHLYHDRDEITLGAWRR
jgi:23S rRNA (cytidine2498-2'-O)-methyltransferase